MGLITTYIMNRVFHIDGSCNNSSKAKVLAKVGGVGIIESLDNKVVKCTSYGPFEEVTSARMEVMGLFLLLRDLHTSDETIEIFCDNQYVVKALSEGWLVKWIFDYRNCCTYRTHIDLWDGIWDRLQKLKQDRVVINLKWVRGHDGNHLNELADEYANKGRIKLIENDKV